MSTKAQRLTQIKAAVAAELGIEASGPLATQIAAISLANESLLASLLDERVTVSETVEINNALRANATQLAELRASVAKPITVMVEYVDGPDPICPHCNRRANEPVVAALPSSGAPAPACTEGASASNAANAAARSCLSMPMSDLRGARFEGRTR